jgi:hypothetical protein
VPSILTLDYDVWSQRFPALVPPTGPVTKPMAEMYWVEAGMYWHNDGMGPAGVTDDQQRLLLDLLTAHIAGLNAAISGALPYNVVGRIANASEGSVSVGVQLSLAPGGVLQEWFAQTKWGFSFWAMTAGFRLARYRPGPRRIFDPAAAVLYGGRGWPV